MLANGGYLQTDEGVKARTKEIEGLNEHYDQLIDGVRDPFKAEREHAALMADPIMAAGVRGFERLQWEMGNGPQTQQKVQALEAAA